MWPPVHRTLCVWPQPENSYLLWGDWHRASGDRVCEVCGHTYYDHPCPPQYQEACPTMAVLCRGELVKL